MYLRHSLRLAGMSHMLVCCTLMQFVPVGVARAQEETAPAAASKPVPQQFRINEKVEVKWGGLWRDAVIMNYRNEWYLVRYGNNSFFKEWVEPWRVRTVGSKQDDIGSAKPNNRKAEEGPPPEKPGPAPEPMFKRTRDDAADAGAPARQKPDTVSRTGRANPQKKDWPRDLDPALAEDATYRSFKRLPNRSGAAEPQKKLAHFDALPAVDIQPVQTLLNNPVSASSQVHIAALGKRGFIFEPASPPFTPEATLIVIDLAEGKVLGTTQIPDVVELLDVSPSGTRVALRINRDKQSNENPTTADPSKKMPIVDIWSVTQNGEEVSCKQDFFFIPFAGDMFYGVQQAFFSDDDHLISLAGFGGKIMWSDLQKKQSIDLNNHMGNGNIIMTPGRTMLAVSTLSTLSFFNLRNGQCIASYNCPTMNNITFTPDGQKIIGINGDSFYVMDLSNGQVNDFPAYGLKPQHLAAISNKHVMAENGIVFDITTGIALWKYKMAAQSETSWDTACGRVWALTSTAKGFALTSAVLPTPAAIEAKEVILPDNLLAVRPGMSISLSIDAGGETENVRQALSKQCEQNGLKIVNDKADLKLIVKTERGKAVDIAFRTRGPEFFGKEPERRSVADYSVTTTIQAGDKIVYTNKYGSSITQTRFVQIKENQSLDQALQEQTTPKYDNFNSMRLPKYIAATSGQTFWRGSSDFPKNDE